MTWQKGLSVTFFLFVISTMISQSAMDAFATLSAIFLIGFWFQQKKAFQLFPRTELEIPFLLFSCAVLMSFAFNWDHQTLALGRIVELKWILNFYLIVSALRVIDPAWESLGKVQIFIWISALFALASPIAGYDLLLGPSSEIQSASHLVRVGGFFSNPMTFAHLHALFFFLIAGLVLQSAVEKKIENKLAALLIILGIALLLTFTRGVWLSVFVGLVFLGFVLNRKLGLLILTGSILVGAALFAMVPTIQTRALQFLSPDSYDSERVWIWKANWQIFLDHPFFGIGYGENTLALSEYYQKIGAPEGLLVSHSHNQYLHILAGMGVFGLISFLCLVVMVLSLTWKFYLSIKNSPIENWKKGLTLGALGGQVSFLIGGLTEANFEHSKVRYVLLIVWAIPIWLKSRQRKFEKSYEL